MEKAVWNLLNGNVKLDDVDVISLVRRLTSEDETPCITIQQAAEVELNREVMHCKHEVIVTRNNVEVWINIWANTEEERNDVINKYIDEVKQHIDNK